ncbi:MAG TPA: MFS transporter [Ktedonobacterales bacterium]|nr:MFS transporter [Ktedonobacterales bacterium]
MRDAADTQTGQGELIGERIQVQSSGVGTLAADAGAAPMGNGEADGEADGVAPLGPGADAGKQRHGFFSPLRLANFRRLIGGQTISRFGDQFYFLAIPWLVLRATSAANAPLALVAVLGSASATTGLFTLLGGVLADRYGPRKMMLASDVTRFVVVGALATVGLLSVPPLWLLATLSALLGGAAGLFYPASSAIIPHLVPGDDLQPANSFDQLTMQSSNFLGPSIAGVILSATQLAFGFVIDAVTFAVSVVTLFAIRVPARDATAMAATPQAGANPLGANPLGALEGAPTAKPKGGLAAMGEALGFLRRSPFLLTLVSLSLVLNFAFMGLLEVGLPLLLKHWVGLAAGPGAMGFVISGFGLGSIIGAVAAGLASRLPRKGLVSVACLLPIAVLVAVMPFAGSPLLLAVDFGVTGLLLGVSNVTIITVIQKLVPLAMMGRVMSIVMLGSFVASPLSTLVYGLAASVISNLSLLFVVGGALFGVGALAALANKNMWQNL